MGLILALDQGSTKTAALEERHGVPAALADPVLAEGARRHGLIRRCSQ